MKKIFYIFFILLPYFCEAQSKIFSSPSKMGVGTLSPDSTLEVVGGVHVSGGIKIDGVNNILPIGTILAYSYSVAPTDYLICDGAAINRVTYANLFSLIGTIYGIGDGVNTFNLPDLRQRLPMGVAASGTGSTLGATGGQIDHIHTIDPPATTTGAPSATSGQLVGVVNVASATHTHDVDVSQFNSGANNPPFLAIYFIIKYQ